MPSDVCRWVRGNLGLNIERCIWFDGAAIEREALFKQRKAIIIIITIIIIIQTNIFSRVSREVMWIILNKFGT